MSAVNPHKPWLKKSKGVLVMSKNENHKHTWVKVTKKHIYCLECREIKKMNEETESIENDFSNYFEVYLANTYEEDVKNRILKIENIYTFLKTNNPTLSIEDLVKMLKMHFEQANLDHSSRLALKR